MSAILHVNSTSSTLISSLSLHDALPIYIDWVYRLMGVSPVTSTSDDFDLECVWRCHNRSASESQDTFEIKIIGRRSEEHTSELQSHRELVCRRLLEKKRKDIRSSRSSCR